MSEPEHAALDTRRRRLLFRATHRGTQENDILIGGFVQTHIVTLTDPDIADLEQLLELPETELGDWLTGRLPIPPELDMPLLRRIKDAAGQ
jgi:antitoxin CptB